MIWFKVNSKLYRKNAKYTILTSQNQNENLSNKYFCSAKKSGIRIHEDSNGTIYTLGTKSILANIINRVTYIPKGLFPQTTSQVATSQLCNFISGNFPIVQFHKRQLPKCTLRIGKTLWGLAGCIEGSSAAASTGLGSCRLGNFTFGKLLFGSYHLGTCLIGKMSNWENAYLGKWLICHQHHA